MPYAILIELDHELLTYVYPGDIARVYVELADELKHWGFVGRQANLYWGEADVTPIDAVLAVQNLSRAHLWFAACAQKLQLLRIEAIEDLSEAL